MCKTTHTCNIYTYIYIHTYPYIIYTCTQLCYKASYDIR